MYALCAVVEPTLVRLPQNTVVSRDSQVTIRCGSDVARSHITWFNMSCDTYVRDRKDCTRIYNGFNDRRNPPRFSVTKVNNATHVTRDLNINSTQLTDAGVYVCAENIPGRSVQGIRSAQLVVVGNYLHSVTSYAYVAPNCYATLFSLCRRPGNVSCMLICILHHNNIKKLAATLRWFTAGGAIRIAVRQLSQTWKLHHYDVIDDVITRKL